MRALHVTLLLVPFLLSGAVAPPLRSQNAPVAKASAPRLRRFSIPAASHEQSAVFAHRKPPFIIATDRRTVRRSISRPTGNGATSISAPSPVAAGGRQDSIRFTAGRYHYIVFKGVGGQYTETPGKTWSGIHVSLDGKDVSTLQCPGTATVAGDWADSIYAAAPAPVRSGQTLEDEDPRFLMWF